MRETTTVMLFLFPFCSLIQLRNCVGFALSIPSHFPFLTRFENWRSTWTARPDVTLRTRRMPRRQNGVWRTCFSNRRKIKRTCNTPRIRSIASTRRSKIPRSTRRKRYVLSLLFLFSPFLVLFHSCWHSVPVCPPLFFVSAFRYLRLLSVLTVGFKTDLVFF